jgi:GNAT superfamily N-acetyltransferase
MTERTGAYGASVEGQIDWLIRCLESGDGFVLLHRDAHGQLDGFAYAVFFQDPLQPYVEVVAIAIPWRGKAFRDEGWAHIVTWARSKGAVRILTAITRAPEAFFRRFHEPLGFTPCAVVLKVDL